MLELVFQHSPNTNLKSMYSLLHCQKLKTLLKHLSNIKSHLNCIKENIILKRILYLRKTVCVTKFPQLLPVYPVQVTFRLFQQGM